MTHSLGPLRTLLVIVALVFAPVLTFDFVNLDDPSHLDNHPYLSPFSTDNLSRIWTTPHLKLYIPLTYTTWSFLAALSGGPSVPAHGTTGVALAFKYPPFGFHFANWVFHLGSVVIAYFIFKLLFPNSRMVIFAAALFALHPIQVEPIAWVSGLKDTLSGVLFLGGLLSLLYGQAKHVGWTVLSYLFCLGALLAKPSAVMWAPLAFLGLTHLGVSVSQRLRLVAIPLLISIPFAWLTTRNQPTNTFGFAIPTLPERIVIAFDTLGFYFVKLIYPLSLAVDYGHSPHVALHETSPLLAIIGLILFLLGIALCYWHTQLRFPVLSALLLLLPVSGLKPFVFQTTSTVSDRYLYLVLFAIAAALCAVAWTRKRQMIAVALLSFLGIRSFQQTFVWKNTETLLTHNIEVQPRSWLALNNLGSWNERKGDFQAALNFYGKSAAIKPQSIVFNNMGAVLMSLGRFDEAAAAYREGTRLNPLSSLDYLGLGFALKELKREQEAQEAFARARALGADRF